jgi:hypothetical protein
MNTLGRGKGKGKAKASEISKTSSNWQEDSSKSILVYLPAISHVETSIRIRGLQIALSSLSKVLKVEKDSEFCNLSLDFQLLAWIESFLRFCPPISKFNRSQRTKLELLEYQCHLIVYLWLKRFKTTILSGIVSQAKEIIIQQFPGLIIWDLCRHYNTQQPEVKATIQTLIAALRNWNEEVKQLQEEFIRLLVTSVESSEADGENKPEFQQQGQLFDAIQDALQIWEALFLLDPKVVQVFQAGSIFTISSCYSQFPNNAPDVINLKRGFVRLGTRIIVDLFNTMTPSTWFELWQDLWITPSPSMQVPFDTAPFFIDLIMQPQVTEVWTRHPAPPQ